MVGHDDHRVLVEERLGAAGALQISHKYGPHAQIDSIARADAELWRVMEVSGGPEAFLGRTR